MFTPGYTKVLIRPLKVHILELIFYEYVFIVKERRFMQHTVGVNVCLNSSKSQK